MSGLVGSITGASKAFNDLGNNPVDGIRQANQIYKRIEIAERGQSQIISDDKTRDDNLIQDNLVASIRQDIDDSKCR